MKVARAAGEVGDGPVVTCPPPALLIKICSLTE